MTDPRADFDAVESATPTPSTTGTESGSALDYVEMRARAEEVMRLVNERPVGMRASSGVWLRSVAYDLARRVVALLDEVAGLSVEVTRLAGREADLLKAFVAERAVSEAWAKTAEAADARLSQIEDERAKEKALVAELRSALEDFRSAFQSPLLRTLLVDIAEGKVDGEVFSNRRPALAALARLASSASALPDGSAVVVGLSGTGEGTEPVDDFELSPEAEREHGEAVTKIAAEHGFPLSDWQPGVPVGEKEA